MKHKINFAVLLMAAITVLLFSCNQTQEKDDTILAADNSAAPVVVAPAKKADKNSLLGNWVRTDAPYQIKISAVQDDGNLKAVYFNPKSINVSKAMWNNADGFLKMYIELRDENYPGSNYKLIYSAEKDALAGEYFQAVEGNTYKVEFTRIK